MSITLEEVAYRLLPRVRAGRVLADREWRTMVHIAECMLDGTQVTLPPQQVADNVERFLLAGRCQRTWRVRVLLTLFEVMPITVHRRSFSQLDAAERRALVETKMIEGRGLWAICAKARLFALMGHYGDLQTHASVGYLRADARRPRSNRPPRQLNGSLPVIQAAAEVSP